MLTDPDFLALAPPEHVMELEASGPRERLAAAVYRASVHLHRAATPTVRRQILALAAAGYGDRDLAAGLAGDGPWTVRWSTGSHLDPQVRNRLARFAGAVGTVTTVVVDGRTRFITGDNHGSVRVWDLITGVSVGPAMTADPGSSDPVLALGTAMVGDHPWVVAGGHTPLWAWDLTTREGRALSGHTDIVTSVTTAVVDGSPVAVTAGYDTTVRIWDLASGEQVGQLPVDVRVEAVAAAMVDGRPCAVTGSLRGTVRLWDLTARTPVGAPMTGHTDRVDAVATTVVDGRPCAVTGGWDGTVRLWDLTTGTPVGEPMTGHPDWVKAVATLAIDGRPCAVTTGERDNSVRVWDLAARRPRESLRSEWTRKRGLAAAVVDGRPYAVTGSEVGEVRVLDLTTSEPVGAPLVGHAFTVRGAATVVLDGRSCAVTAGTDDVVRVWDLATGQQVGEPLAGHDGGIYSLATTTIDSVPHAVTGGQDGTVRLWNPATGQQVGEALAGHVGHVWAVASTTVDGVPHAVTGGQDGTVRLWNLATGQQVGKPLLDHNRAISAVATATVDGIPHALAGAGDGKLRLWNLATGGRAGKPLAAHDAIWAVASTTVDGAPHAVTGHGDGTVQLWNLATRRPVGAPLTGHDDLVRAVATTTVGSAPHAVTGSQDGTVRVWDLVRREQVGEALVCPLPVHAVSVGPDGCLVVGFGAEIAVFAASTAARSDTGAPRRVDTVELTDRTDFTDLARDALLGRVGGSLRGDCAPVDWLFRAYAELTGSAYADRLAHGVSACLTAPEPDVRAQALVFFQSHPDAAGAGRIVDLVAGDRALFRSVQDPYRPGTDLEWQLLAVLAARIGTGDERAVALARAEALLPGRATPLIADLTSAAPDWVIEHAEEIVRGTPAAGATILIQLQGSGRDLTTLARRIAPLCHGDERFELDIARFIDDVGLRQVILDAVHTGTTAQT